MILSRRTSSGEHETSFIHTIATGVDSNIASLIEVWDYNPGLYIQIGIWLSCAYVDVYMISSNNSLIISCS